MTEEHPDRLPPTPAAVIALLREAEDRFRKEAEDLVSEIRGLREALEAEDRPEVEKVGAALVAGEGLVTATGVVHDLSGTVVVQSGTSGDISVVPSGSASGSWEFQGSAAGEAPPDPEISTWVDKVKKHGPTGLRIGETILRIWSSLNG